MDNLTRSSSIWPKIKESLNKQESLGTHLTLRCQVHPSVFTRVCTAADFHNVPEGGCLQICGTQLQCGHRCKSVCHVRNRYHANMMCHEPCVRVPGRCELQHKCLKLCFEDCGDCRTLVSRTLQCGHTSRLCCYIDVEKYKCAVEVEVELPDCGHKVKKPCHMDINLISCSHACEDRLPCGHSCSLNCHVKDDPDHLEYQCEKPCTRKNVGCKDDHICIKKCYEECGDCRIPVSRKLPHCEHPALMPCSVDSEIYLCRTKCSKILPCGHPCPNICSAECGNCQVKVRKQLVGCGHHLQVKCCEEPDPKMCMDPCKRTLPCGHKCTTRCSVACTEKCLELVPCIVRPMCGHSIEIPCYMQRKILAPDSEVLLSLCKIPCGTLLRCGHRCVGTCGECMQGRIHRACKEKCGKTLICGHSCNVPCADTCPPCNRKCNYRCKHSKCSRICGHPCVQCKEPCDWACRHHRCRKLCFEFCDREPCNEPCEKLLPCKHPCIGFCGETCPPLCRICNKDEVTEVFFGTEDDPDARFVYLEDCKHVLEATGLEQWMAQSDGEIKLKDCPLCKTPIAKTQRFMNIVKKIYRDVCHVKSRVFGNRKEIEASRDDLKAELLLVNRHSSTMKESTEFNILYNKLSAELQPVLRKRLNILSAANTATLKVQVEIFRRLAEYYSNTHKALDGESRGKLIAHMDMLLRVVKMQEKKISVQETEDVNMEIQRFYRLCQLYKLKSEGAYRINRSDPEVKRYYEAAHRIAYSIEKFSVECEMELKNALENLSKVLKSAVEITDAERKEIVLAMGYKQGHWYKCPNGHIYIITECGGAMVEAQCSVCGAAIGGTNHRLLSTNAVATEMDGATRPAWPQ